MRTALDSISKSLARVRDISVDIDKNVLKALKDTALLERHDTMQCALTVVLSGYLESFLTLMAEECIRELCSKNLPFEQLPLRIRSVHFTEGAEVLAKRARKEVKTLRKDSSGRGLVDSEELAHRIASVISGTGYELVWEAFAETRTNPGPEMIREFLGRFDIDGGWSKLAQKTGLSERMLETSLSSFMLIRNECAHTGTATKIPTPSDIRAYCDLIEKISSGIAFLLEEHLSGPTFLRTA